MPMPFPNSPSLNEKIGETVTRLEQNFEYLNDEIGNKVAIKNYSDTLSSGRTAFTGIGFQPTTLIFVSNETAGQSLSWGVYDGSNHRCIFRDYNSNSGQADSEIYLYQSDGNIFIAEVTSLDSDGFTMFCSPIGSPSGSASFFVIGLA